MDTVNALIKLAPSVIALVAAALHFVPKAQDSKFEREKDRKRKLAAKTSNGAVHPPMWAAADLRYCTLCV